MLLKEIFHTSNRVSKKLYFKRSELGDWLTGMKMATKAEIEKEATDYIISKGKFKW